MLSLVFYLWVLKFLLFKLNHYHIERSFNHVASLCDCWENSLLTVMLTQWLLQPYFLEVCGRVQWIKGTQAHGWESVT